MKRQLMATIILFPTLLLIGVVAAFAMDSTDADMPIQGLLTNSSGVPVPDGPHTFVFKIYADSIGGTAKWTETQSVTTKAGMWSVRLGAINKIPDSTMNSPKVFLGMKVGADPEMTPRTKLGATPFARFSAGINGHIKTEPGKVRVMYADTSTNAGIAIDATATGGSIKLLNQSAPGNEIWLGPPDTLFRLFKNGMAIISADATASGGTLKLRSQSAPGDSISLGPPDTLFRLFKSGKAIISAFMNGAMGALNLTDGIDDDKVAMEPHSIAFTTGAKATTVAGLSAQGLTLTAGASNGYVLTSNASGLGTWQPASGGGSSCWLCPTGNYTYLSDATDSVGIGIATPIAKLHVAGDIFCSSVLSSSSTSTGLTANAVNDGSGRAYGGDFSAVGSGSGIHSGIHSTGQGSSTDNRGVEATAYSTGGSATCFIGYGEMSSGTGTAYGAMIGAQNLGTGMSKGIQANGYVTSSDAAYGGNFYASRAAGSTGMNFGVFGSAQSSGGPNYGVYGSATGGTENLAGYFEGDLATSGTLSKAGGSFKIDHPLDPENKYLQHSFVESPDMKNIYDGNVITNSNGDAVVSLPSYFSALNQDFRYQLTVIGQFAQAIVSQKIDGNQFSIKTDKPNVEVSWQVTGIRKDAWAEKNRIQVEVDKKPGEEGKYLHPEAFGKLIEQSVNYEQIKAARDIQTTAPVATPDASRR
jgi:hypothetical protein